MKTLRSVLVVEDNEHDRYLMERVLRRSGRCAAVEVLTDGEQALARLRDDAGLAAPDLVLLDLHMPRLDGIELLGALPAALPPVVVMLASSAHLPQYEQARAANAGVVGWQVKPLEAAAVEDLAARYGHEA